MRRKSVSITLTAILASLVMACGEGEQKAAGNPSETIEEYNDLIELTQAQFKSNGMALGSLEEKEFPITIHTNGMIDVPPENKAVVSATLGGYIKRTPLLIGDTVKKGQILVTIENPEFITLQQKYMEVKQQLAYLQSEYDRQKMLMDENITSQKSFLRAESDFKTANAKYDGLRKQLTMLNISPSEVEKGNISSVATIYAPINGSITKMNVTKGTYVSQASPILEIIDNDHIHLELSVFEKDILKVKKGQPIRFTIPEVSQDIYKAEVYLIGTSIGENRTIKVHGHLLEEKENNFLTGMFVNAEIVTEHITARALPSTAIIESEDKNYVLRLKERTNGGYAFEQIEMAVGKSADGFSVVRDTLKFSSADQFLIKGAFGLIGEKGGHSH